MYNRKMANTITPQLTRPELLSPAGNLEKLSIAFKYGADAVYIGGHVFGLRRFASNFSIDHICQGIDIANQYQKRVYVVLNGFAHECDLEALKSHLDDLNRCQPHGLIISDMGVFQLAKDRTSIPLHISTQASVTNKYACELWQELGASRIILAREVSVSECRSIMAHCPIELEVFVHGAMCASYSGKCTISNYTAGRDSNRGGCIQSCRHAYAVSESKAGLSDTTESGLTLMNAKDLMAIRTLPQLISIGVSSLKIEGRMKSNLYVANTTQLYREAIDTCYEAAILGKSVPDAEFSRWETALSQVSNRLFSRGGLDDDFQGESIHYNFKAYEKSVEYMGTIKDQISDMVVSSVANAFSIGDTLVVIAPHTSPTPFTVTTLRDCLGRPISRTKPNSVVRLNCPIPFRRDAILVKPI